VRGCHDASAREAEADTDGGQPYPAASRPPRAPYARGWLGPKRQQPGFFQQPLAQVALEFQTGSR
jgi:hypothetical protein